MIARVTRPHFILPQAWKQKPSGEELPGHKHWQEMPPAIHKTLKPQVVVHDFPPENYFNLKLS